MRPKLFHQRIERLTIAPFGLHEETIAYRKCHCCPHTRRLRRSQCSRAAPTWHRHAIEGMFAAKTNILDECELCAEAKVSRKMLPLAWPPMHLSDGGLKRGKKWQNCAIVRQTVDQCVEL